MQPPGEQPQKKFEACQVGVGSGSSAFDWGMADPNLETITMKKTANIDRIISLRYFSTGLLVVVIVVVVGVVLGLFFCDTGGMADRGIPI